MSWRRVQIATWPGGVFADDAWDVLIADSTHLVLAIDGQAEREPQTTRFLDHISTLPNLPNARCVVWTKCDLRTRRPWMSRSILSETPFAHRPSFKTRRDQLHWNALTTWR